ncbi:MAG: GNAT family N-acetyltransferase [Clostridia bacterium]|nr:GNAT family N-acetyltransferase [Clostridia bacterium]
MLKYITLREMPALKEYAADWFHSKWGVPKEAYLDCMDAYLRRKTELGWYLCLEGDRIVGGMGVIENDFHNRKDLSPNICAVYTEEAYRNQGIAGNLLNMTVNDLSQKGITPVYLVTDHVGFYERYGWEFLCMVQGDGEPEMSRMYIRR